MKFKSRLDRLEAMRPNTSWVPSIIFHPIIEPSENGPREVGAFAKIETYEFRYRMERAEN